MKFRDIPRLTEYGSYCVDVAFKDLDRNIKRYIEEYNLELDPDFQRGHVWNLEKQVKYIEFVLRRGHSSKDFLFNCPDWNSALNNEIKDFVLVDGKQRLTACLKFINNEIKVFGHYYNEFEDWMPFITFKFYINDLKTRAEVLQWYLELNSGGVVHTEEELNKVKLLLEKELND